MGHYKDLTETGNRARKVSGTQGRLRCTQSSTEHALTCQVAKQHTQSVRNNGRVDFVAPNDLSSVDFETTSKGKRKYKPDKIISTRQTSQEVVID